MNENKTTVKCKVCDNDFELETSGLTVGDIIECSVCGGTLEIISLEPLMCESIVRGK